MYRNHSHTTQFWLSPLKHVFPCTNPNLFPLPTNPFINSVYPNTLTNCWDITYLYHHHFQELLTKHLWNYFLPSLVTAQHNLFQNYHSAHEVTRLVRKILSPARARYTHCNFKQNTELKLQMPGHKASKVSTSNGSEQRVRKIMLGRSI